MDGWDFIVVIDCPLNVFKMGLMPLNGLLIWMVLMSINVPRLHVVENRLSLLCPLACSAAVPALQNVPVQPASPLRRSSAPLPLGLRRRARRLRASRERQALRSRGNRQKGTTCNVITHRDQWIKRYLHCASRAKTSDTVLNEGKRYAKNKTFLFPILFDYITIIKQ